MKLKKCVFALWFLVLCTFQLLDAAVVTNLSPNTGAASGGDLVTITGSGFTGATGVKFGRFTASNFTFFSDNKVTAVTPPAVPIVAKVVVENLAQPVSVDPLNADQLAFTGNWLAFVTTQTGTLESINIPVNTTRPPIPISQGGIAIAITPDGSTVYVADTVNVRIEVFDVATNSSIGTITPVVGQVHDIVITPDGTKAYVTTLGPDGILPISLPNNQMAIIPIPGVTPNKIAITPDGTKAFVTARDETNNLAYLFPVDLVTGVAGPGINFGSPFFLLDEVAITPDGSTAYLPIFSPPGVIPVDVASNTVGPTITGFTHLTSHIAIAPDGKTVYISGAGNDITAINTSNNTLGPTFNIPLGGRGQLFITPDSKTAYVIDSFSGSVVSIDLSSGVISPSIAVSQFPKSIKITPDQAPLALFTSNGGFASGGTIFDASNSVSPVGTIVSYQWDFGDGTTLITSNPTITHVYQAEGTFLVTLTVVNSAGTSTERTYTGQVVGNNGGPSAVASQLVNIQPSQAPSDFIGVIFKNRFLNQTEYFLKARFEPSTSPDVVGYRIFLGDQVIKEISATGPFKFKRKCLQSEEEARAFTVAAVLQNGTLSEKVPITIIKGKTNTFR